MNHPDDNADRRPLAPRQWSTARPGRDRRHLFPGRRRRIAPTFTDNEYAAIVAAAVRLGLTPTGFCAHAAVTVAHAGTAPRPGDGEAADPLVEALAGLQAELADARTAVNRVGTNLNQAVTVLHATGTAPVWLRHIAERVAAVIARVDEAASAVHRRLAS